MTVERRRTKSRPPICRMSWPQARTVRRAKHPKQGTRIALLSRRIPTRALAVGLVENLTTPTHILCRGESHLGLVLLVTNHSSELSSLWCSTKLAEILKLDYQGAHFIALGAHWQRGAPILRRCFQSIFLPNAEQVSSTARSAVRLCSSITGLTSTTSKLRSRPWSARISMAR